MHCLLTESQVMRSPLSEKTARNTYEISCGYAGFVNWFCNFVGILHPVVWDPSGQKGTNSGLYEHVLHLEKLVPLIFFI